MIETTIHMDSKMKRQYTPSPGNCISQGTVVKWQDTLYLFKMLVKWQDTLYLFKMLVKWQDTPVLILEKYV